MGLVVSWLSNLSTMWSGDKECRILVLGIDNAGKTSLLHRLQWGEVRHTTPTIGLNIENVSYGKLHLSVWDLGGQDTLRAYWRLYFSGATAVVFVIDSCDVERMGVVKQELHGVLNEEELADAPLLVLANKQDLPNSISEGQISAELELPALKGRPWAIFRTSVLKNEGVDDAMQWLSEILLQKK